MERLVLSCCCSVSFPDPRQHVCTILGTKIIIRCCTAEEPTGSGKPEVFLSHTHCDHTMFLDLTSTRTYYHGNCMLRRGNWLKGLFDSYFKWWLLAGRQQTRATTHKIAVAIYGMLGRNSCAIKSASMLTSFVDIQMLNMDKTPCPTSMALHCASLILVSSECPFNAYEHTACRRALRTYSKCPEYGGKARHSRV